MNRKLRQLGVVLVLWVLVVTLLAWAVSFLAGTASAFSLLKLLLSISKGTLLQSGLLSHCWFLWALAFLYILLPLLSRLTLRGKCTLFGILVCLGIGIQVVSCLVGQPVECHVPQAFRIWIWLEYFLLGGLVYPICKKGLKVGSTGVLLAATSIVAIAWQLFAGSALMPEATGAAHAEYFYDSVTCVVWSAALFAFCISLKPSQSPWVYLASLAMGVYLLHKLVIRLLGYFVSFADPVWGCGLGFVVVLVVSFVVIATVKKLLPKVFKLFCAV